MSIKKEAVHRFIDFGVRRWIVDQCKEMGIKEPTPVQQHCIPEALKGRDVIGCAKTGTGKTLAFAIPILQQLAEDPYGIFALILTPTRELAFQIAEQFLVLGKPISMSFELCSFCHPVDFIFQNNRSAIFVLTALIFTSC